MINTKTKDFRSQLLNILVEDVKPAMGCTEPVAVALACAKAKELLGEEIVKHKVLVSPNVYKNGLCVGIPGTDRVGLKDICCTWIYRWRIEKWIKSTRNYNKRRSKNS